MFDKYGYAFPIPLNGIYAGGAFMQTFVLAPQSQRDEPGLGVLPSGRRDQHRQHQGPVKGGEEDDILRRM